MRVSGEFDDRAYLCAAEKWVGVFSEGCPPSSHFSGAAISWFPALVLARFFSFLTEDSFEAWAGFWVGLSSFLFWFLSLFLIERIIRSYQLEEEPNPAKHFISSLSFPVIFLLNVPVLYFATTRTFMVHTPELFWSLVFVYLLKKGKWGKGLAALVVLLATRPGNLGAVFLFPAFLESSSLWQQIPKRVRVLGIFVFSAVSGLIIFKIIVSGYNGSFLIPMILNFHWHSIGTLLFAEDFGLLWSQPVWLVGVFLWIRHIKRGNPVTAGAGLWLFISGLTALFWPTRGGTFGYRYLIGSYAAVLLLFLESVSYWTPQVGHQMVRLAKTFLIFGAFWGAIQSWIYPAPKPYWPWEKPLHTQMGIPFGQLVNWTKQVPELVAMNRFSQAGQLAEKIQLITPSQFTRQGGVWDYALQGTVGLMNFGISSLTFIFLTFAIGALLFLRKKPASSKKKK